MDNWFDEHEYIFHYQQTTLHSSKPAAGIKSISSKFSIQQGLTQFAGHGELEYSFYVYF